MRAKFAFFCPTTSDTQLRYRTIEVNYQHTIFSMLGSRLHCLLSPSRTGYFIVGGVMDASQYAHENILSNPEHKVSGRKRSTWL